MSEDLGTFGIYCSVNGCLYTRAPGSKHCAHHTREVETITGKMQLKELEAFKGKIEAAMLDDPNFPRSERIGIPSKAKAYTAEEAGLKTVAGSTSMSQKYPKYYKPIPKDWTEIDVYGVCKLFPVKDDSGCIHHALKKLLVPGVRTGGKSFYNDIKEARDTLNRWLELNEDQADK